MNWYLKMMCVWLWWPILNTAKTSFANYPALGRS